MHAPARDSPSNVAMTMETSSEAAAKANDSSGSSRTGQLSLPQTLMKLLNDGSAKEVIWWLPSGKEFAINANEFPAQVLEVYFPGCKYASFIRRVHKMGFSRETRALKKVTGMKIPPNTVAFRHPNFQRDHPELADGIKQRASGNNHGSKSAQAKKAQGSVSTGSSRSSSPSHEESPVVRPRAAPTEAPMHSISIPAYGAEEEKQPSLHDGMAAAMAAAAPAGGMDLSNNVYQYLETLRQQRDQVLLHRSQEDERLMLQLERERRLREIILEEQTTQERLRLARARQIMAAAPRPNSLNNVLSGQPSSLITSLSSSVPTQTSGQEDILLRLRLLRELQQAGTVAPPASLHSYMDTDSIN